MSLPFHHPKKKEKINYIQVWLNVLGESSKFSWGLVYSDSKNTSSLSGISNESDINRVYLLAIIEFLEWINDNDKRNSVDIFTENKYIVNVFGEWFDKWKRNDFVISSGDRPIDRPNADLLRKIEILKSPIREKLRSLDATSVGTSEKLRSLDETSVGTSEENSKTSLELNVYYQFQKNEFKERVATLCRNELNYF